MNSKQINDLVSSFIEPCLYLGVCSRSQVRTKVAKHAAPMCLVSNTDSPTGSGKHWIAYWVEPNGKIEFFDSYGDPPTYYAFGTPCNIYNDHSLQSLNSKVCGEYCIFYLLSRARGNSMWSIANSFSNDSGWNDDQVVKFVKRLKSTTPLFSPTAIDSPNFTSVTRYECCCSSQLP